MYSVRNILLTGIPCSCIVRSMFADRSARHTESLLPNPTTKTYTSLNDAFAFFNARLFDGRLPACLITMQRSKSAYGYFAGGRFAKRTGRRSPAK